MGYSVIGQQIDEGTQQNLLEAQADYALIEQAIRYLEENFTAQPDLATVAAHVGLSEYHFQRLFSRWAGISPKRFVQFLTLDYAKSLLADAQSVLDTTLESGLSSPGRLHDLFVTFEAMTPGTYKQKGDGLTIRYGQHATPFGSCLIGVTERGICHLAFGQPGEDALAALRQQWPLAQLVADRAATQPIVAQIFAPTAVSNQLPLYVCGTNFQVKVWQALLHIAPGTAVDYQTIATLISQPRASRAVGTAVAHNGIAYLIPCHRVIRRSGSLGNYRWGNTRKKAILGWEAAQQSVN